MIELINLMEQYARLTLWRDSSTYVWKGYNVCHLLERGYDLPKSTPKEMIEAATILVNELSSLVTAIEALSEDNAPTYKIFDCKKRDNFAYIVNRWY